MRKKFPSTGYKADAFVLKLSSNVMLKYSVGCIRFTDFKYYPLFELFLYRFLVGHHFAENSNSFQFIPNNNTFFNRFFQSKYYLHV